MLCNILLSLCDQLYQHNGRVACDTGATLLSLHQIYLPWFFWWRYTFETNVTLIQILFKTTWSSNMAGCAKYFTIVVVTDESLSIMTCDTWIYCKYWYDSLILRNTKMHDATDKRLLTAYICTYTIFIMGESATIYSNRVYTFYKCIACNFAYVPYWARC